MDGGTAASSLDGPEPTTSPRLTLAIGQCGQPTEAENLYAVRGLRHRPRVSGRVRVTDGESIAWPRGDQPDSGDDLGRSGVLEREPTRAGARCELRGLRIPPGRWSAPFT